MEHRSINTPSPILTNTLPKSRGSVGSSRKSAYEEERYEQLLKEFSEIDKDNSSSLSFEEILNFLSSKQDEEFDFILCQEVFARLDKNNDSIITREEFVESYVEIECLIMKRIKNLKKELVSSNRQLEENKEKLKKSEKSEILNAAGIISDSLATLVVKSAQNLIPTTTDGVSNPYILIECGEYKEKTTTKRFSLTPVWDEVFTVPVHKKGQEIHLTVLSDNTLGQKFVGKVTIPLLAIADQLKHEQFFMLYGENPGEKWQGKVYLELQWIWSRVKYYKDIICEWERLIDEDKDTVNSLQVQLEKLRKPFGHLTGIKEKSQVYSVPITPRLDSKEYGLSRKESRGMAEVAELGDQRNLQKALAIYVVLTVLVNFARPDFLSVRNM